VSAAYCDDFNIMLNSGTTGVFKGIVRTHFARQQFGLALAMACRVNFGAVAVLTTPMYSNGHLTHVLDVVGAQRVADSL